MNKEYVYSNKVDDVVAVWVDEVKLVELSPLTPLSSNIMKEGEDEIIEDDNDVGASLVGAQEEEDEEVTNEEENVVLTEYKLISLNLPTILAANVKEDNPNK